ncbi:MAG: hypothetical protein ACRDFC_02100 [Ignavibacteria bacterium]
MKKYKYIVISLLIFIPLIYNSCDDAGITELAFHRAGDVTLTQSNLKPLNPTVDGVYEAWIKLDTLGGQWYSLGRFNISLNGTIIDLSGNAMTFTFMGDTNQLHLAIAAMITVETSAFTGQPGPLHLISGSLDTTADSAYGNLNLGGADALGSVGQTLIGGAQGCPHGKYILRTPSNNNVECLKGIWFCDTLGNAHLPAGLGLSGSPWIYQGWLKDRTNPNNPVYLTMGRFSDPYNADLDGKGPCAGPGNGYNKPGQDWVNPSSSCVQNLNNGNYEVFITLEPTNDPALNSPFFVKLFAQTVIHSSLGCGRDDNLFNQCATFPRVRIKINK